MTPPRDNTDLGVQADLDQALTAAADLLSGMGEQGVLQAEDVLDHFQKASRQSPMQALAYHFIFIGYQQTMQTIKDRFRDQDDDPNGDPTHV